MLWTRDMGLLCFVIFSVLGKLQDVNRLPRTRMWNMAVTMFEASAIEQTM